jgi:hypothetical protein
MTSTHDNQTQDLPIVVGVVGHRFLADEEIAPLRRSILEVVKEIDSVANGLPTVLLSPLAEGADQLIAEVVSEAVPHWKLCNTIPLPKDAFMETLSTDDAKEAFSCLNSKMESSQIDVPQYLVEGESDRDATDEKCYEVTGDFIARHSHILIALWDGQWARGQGGTGDTIAHALNMSKRYSQDEPFKDTPGCFVYHIKAFDKRSDVNIESFENGKINRLQPKYWLPELADSVQSEKGSSFDLDQLVGAFSCLSAADEDLHYGNIGISVKQKDSPTSKELNSDPVFGAYDAMAGCYQKKAWNLASVRLMLLVCAIIIFSLIVGPIDLPAWFSGVFAVVVVGIVLELGRSIKRVEQKFYSYRAIAELLRINFFLKKQHCKAEVLNQPFYDLSLLVLLRSTIWQDITLDIERQNNSGFDIDVIDAFCQYWIDERYKHFAESMDTKRKQVKLNKRLVNCLLTAAVLCVVASAMFKPDQVVANWMMCGAGVLGLIAVTVGFHASCRGFEGQSKRYSMMVQLYGNYKDTIENFKKGNLSVVETSALFLALGRRAVSEVIVWHKLRN